jgi:hypothetical protein
MTPALARIKRQVRAGIGINGGNSGAMATVGRGHSVVGDWNNLNHPAFPPLDCAFAIDEVAIAQNAAPPIVTAYAAELGLVCFRLPDEAAGEVAPGRIERATIDASAEFGEVAGAVREATRDGKVCGHDRDRIVAAIDEGLAALVRLRAVVAMVPDSS